MKLTQLKNSEVLPQNLSLKPGHTTSQESIDFMRGANWAVDEIKKVELVMNEEKIIEILSNKQDYEQIPLLTRIKIAQSLIQSQHLFLSLKVGE